MRTVPSLKLTVFGFHYTFTQWIKSLCWRSELPHTHSNGCRS